jgi:hypothetical protein
MVKQQDSYIMNFSLSRENHGYTNIRIETPKTLENDKKETPKTDKHHNTSITLFEHMAYKC